MAGPANAIRMGRAYVEAGLEDSKLRAGLRSLQAEFMGFGRSVLGVGAMIGGVGVAVGVGLLAAVKHFADSGSALNDMSERTGFAVEELSALKFAFEQAGAGAEDLEAGIKFMQKGGHGRTAAEFTALVAEIGAMEDPIQRTSRALEVFGRGGFKITALKDIVAKTQEAHAAGIVWTTAQAKAADDLGDAWDKFKAQLGGVVNAIGNQLAPVLTDTLAQVSPIMSAIIADVNQLPLVFRLVAAEVKVAWIEMIDTLKKQWNDFAGHLLDLNIERNIVGAGAAWENFWAETKARSLHGTLGFLRAVGLMSAKEADVVAQKVSDDREAARGQLAGNFQAMQQIFDQMDQTEKAGAQADLAKAKEDLDRLRKAHAAAVLQKLPDMRPGFGGLGGMGENRGTFSTAGLQRMSGQAGADMGKKLDKLIKEQELANDLAEELVQAIYSIEGAQFG